MREIRTSGTVRGGDGDIPTYSALDVPDSSQMPVKSVPLALRRQRGEELQLARGEGLLQNLDEEATEEAR